MEVFAGDLLTDDSLNTSELNGKARMWKGINITFPHTFA